MRPTKALLLAGGKSERMGQDKAAILVAGETQLARSWALLESQVSEVFLSIREDMREDALRANYPQIIDHPQGRGPLAGVRAALELDPNVDWLVLACDLPKLSAQTLANLLAMAERHPTANAVAYRSEHDDLPEPLCAIWRRPMIEVIDDAFARERYCARKCLLVANAHLIEPIGQGALDNMNTPQDRERLVS